LGNRRSNRIRNVFFGEAEFVADLEPRRTGELGGFVFLIASEEHRAAGGKGRLFGDFA